MNPLQWENYLKGQRVLVDPKFFKKISVQKKLLENGVTKFIFIFPTPTIGTESFYAILYFDKFKNYQYYTLELEYGNDFNCPKGSGLVCGQKGHQHLNFNTFCKVNLNDFENCVNILYNKY